MKNRFVYNSRDRLIVYKQTKKVHYQFLSLHQSIREFAPSSKIDLIPKYELRIIQKFRAQN